MIIEHPYIEICHLYTLKYSVLCQLNIGHYIHAGHMLCLSVKVFTTLYRSYIFLFHRSNESLFTYFFLLLVKIKIFISFGKCLKCQHDIIHSKKLYIQMTDIRTKLITD